MPVILFHFTNLLGRRNHSISLHHNLNLHDFKQVLFVLQMFIYMFIFKSLNMCINKKQIYIYIYISVCVPIKNAGSQSLYTSQIIKRLLPSRSVKGTVSEVFPNVMIREVLECHWEDKVQPAEKLSRVLTLTHWYLYHSIFFQKKCHHLHHIYTKNTPLQNCMFRVF